jgi:hypothetical protein
MPFLGFNIRFGEARAKGVPKGEKKGKTTSKREKNCERSSIYGDETCTAIFLNRMGHCDSLEQK